MNLNRLFRFGSLIQSRAATCEFPTQIVWFCDPTCPFCAKALKVLKTLEAPAGGSLQLSIILTVQPWHWQSSSLMKALLAVGLLKDREPFLKMLEWTYEKRDALFRDEAVVGKTQSDVYDLFYKQFAVVCPDVSRKMFDDSLANDVNAAMKVAIKYGRQMNAHSTPSFYINGILNSQASSQWTKEQWQEELAKYN